MVGLRTALVATHASSAAQPPTRLSTRPLFRVSLEVEVEGEVEVEVEVQVEVEVEVEARFA